MAVPEYAIVGRVRKPQGIRGELAVETITDAPDAVFAPGRRVIVGGPDGSPAAEPREWHVVTTRPHKGGLVIAFREVPDRNDAERWRDRYLLVPVDELEPPDEEAGEVWLHDLLGMRVERTGGGALGVVEAVHDVPQGLVLDLGPHVPVMLPFTDDVIVRIDREARVITVEPPPGLLD